MDLKSRFVSYLTFPNQVSASRTSLRCFRMGPLREAVRMMADAFRDDRVDVVVGVESRGFIFGSPIAQELGVGFVIVRKPGKLPSDTYRVSMRSNTAPTLWKCTRTPSSPVSEC